MILFILIIALTLRLINIDQSLWLDEAINVLAAKDLTFWHYVTGYSQGDFHPPGYFVILWIWSHLFGFSELSVRLPSVIFGLGAVYFNYLLGKEMFSKKVGILAALFLALGPLHVYYSQEARMYSFGAFAATFSMYFFYKLLKGDKGTGWIYVVSLMLVLYSDYLTYLVILVQIVYVFMIDRKKFKEWIKFFIFGMITILPWLYYFPSQLENGRTTATNVPGWKKVVGGSNIKNILLVGIKSIIGRIRLSDNLYIYGSLMSAIGLIYSFVLYKGFKDFKKEEKLLGLWLILPVALAAGVSMFIPVLSYFRMLFILPAFYLVLALGVFKIQNQFFYKASLMIIIGISFVSLLIYYSNPKYQRENWKYLVKLLQSKGNSNTLIVFEDSNLPAPFRYYSGNDFNIPSVGGIMNFPADSESDIRMFDKKYERIFLVDYLVEISDPGRFVDKKLTSLGYKVVAVDDIPSLGLIYEYSK